MKFLLFILILISNNTFSQGNFYYVVKADSTENGPRAHRLERVEVLPIVPTGVSSVLETKQAKINGTGFVKATGETLSYDNSTYITSAALSPYSTTVQANALYATSGHNHAGVYQPVGSYLVAADIAGKANIASPSFTGPVTTTGSIGYASGAGGTVTQNANKTTAVTLNKTSGQITMSGAALAAGAEVAFTLNNSTISSTDVVIVNVQSVGTAGAYLVGVGAVGNGSCSITVSNASAGSLSQAIVLNFAVVKGVNN